MFPAILSAVGISLSGVIPPGPMFAVTVAKSYGSPWAGAKISFGHAIIEVPLILLIYFGFARFFGNATVQIALNLLGGGMLIWMAVGVFRARREVVDRGKDLAYGAVTAGIIMSATNPFFLLWWATVGSMLVMKLRDFGTTGLSLFIMTHWLCDLIWLSIVSFVIYRTRALWGRKIQEFIFVICSLVLLGFGGWAIALGIQHMV